MTPDTVHLLTAVVGLLQSAVALLTQMQTSITASRVVVLGRDITDELTAAGWVPPGEGDK